MTFEQAFKLTLQGQRVGPLAGWTVVRERTLGLMVDLGLKPHHKVLDLGCGHLRNGSLLIKHLEPENYCGIEPDRPLLAAGRLEFLDAQTEAVKKPRFAHNDDFDFTIFEERFDWVLARSIWSHASRDQIRASLNSFVLSSRPGATFLASFYPVTWRKRELWPYYGEEWVYPGGCAHFRGFIKRECRKRDLRVRFKRQKGVAQLWAIVERP